MTDKKLRTCNCCGKNYYFCPKCQEDKDKPYFYFVFCSENCRDIYDITSKFEDGILTATEARERLDKLNLPKFDNLGTSYKTTIANIMSTTTTTEFINEGDVKSSEDIITEVTTEDVEENTKDEKLIKKSKNKRTKPDIEQ